MVTITYKTKLQENKPYNSESTDQYLAFLNSNKGNIQSGELGVYLARKIRIDQQSLYFPFLDIDGDKNAPEDEQIKSAIGYLNLTLHCFRQLQVEEHFKVIATGNTGFRVISPILLNEHNYWAFVNFVKNEMPHIHDTGPTEDIDMPHQLFVYKGHPNHSRGRGAHRSSTVIDVSEIDPEALTPDLYKAQCSGMPDPEQVIGFMKIFFDKIVPVTDLSVLGALGDKIHQYKNLAAEIQVNPFNYLCNLKKAPNISIDAFSRMLNDKQIVHKIQNRGNGEAISFQNLPCPMCGKTSANARAHPPGFRLKCFNMNCPANDSAGMPSHEWAGIQAKEKSRFKPIVAQNTFTDREKAQDIIRKEIKNQEDLLLLITPGTGKTHVALETVIEMAPYNQILFSSFNRKLQEESYEKAKALCSDQQLHSWFHRLVAREEVCKKKDELRQETKLGYSPSEMLCKTCEYKNECLYFTQKQNIDNGVCFVTHHMLQYLGGICPSPDLIILDENVLSGFLMEESLTDADIKSLYKVCDVKYCKVLDDVNDLAQSLEKQIMRNNANPMTINGKALLQSNHKEDSIIGLLAKKNSTTESEIVRHVDKTERHIDAIDVKTLHEKQVNRYAIDWLRGLVSPDKYPFLQIGNNSGCSFNMKYIAPFEYRNTPVKILDATGDTKSARALLGKKFKEIKLDVHCNTRRIHIKKTTSRNVLKKTPDKYLKDLISTMLEEVTAEKVLVVTYKMIIEKTLAICKEIAPEKTFYPCHFHGPRGINSFSECDAALVLGLPYANITSSAQNACILLPGDKNDEIRQHELEINMMRELYQMVHRIRPVNKSYTEIVIAGTFWPTILPEPNKVIDQSASNKMELFINILEPWVKEFGFLNPDILFLANIYEKAKEKAAKNFRRKIFDILRAHLYFHDTQNKKALFQFSPLLPGEDLYKHLDLKLTNSIFKSDVERKEKLKFFFVIYKYYYKKELAISNQLISRLLEIYKKNKKCLEDTPMSNPSDQQWAELKKCFQERYPHFERFKIKLPHARGNFVDGVGIKERVLEFYTELNKLKLFGRVDTSTYQTKAHSLKPIEAIPEQYITIYVPPELSNVFYVGIQKYVLGPENITKEEALTGLCASLQNKTIITNNGVYLAQKIAPEKREDLDIVDIQLVEKIVDNRDITFQTVGLGQLFEKHGLGNNADSTTVVSQMHKVWENQKKSLDQFGLNKIVELEKRIMKIAAEMEQTGMFIDVKGLLEYQEQISREIKEVKEKLYSLIPEIDSLNNDRKLLSSVNRRLRIQLDSLSKDNLEKCKCKTKDARKNYFIDLILKYKAKTGLNQYINTMQGLIGCDDRIRDKINPLAAKNGRFSRFLHTVRKAGKLRSFFSAPEGYNLIVADFSSQEARILIGLANDENGLEIIKSGGDIYLQVAKVLTGKPETECHAYRDLAKVIVLGINNGQTAYSIHQELHEAGFFYDWNDVQKFVFRYRNRFQSIIKYQEDIAKRACSRGFIRTVLGRRLKISENTKPNTLINFPITATASDGFKIALLAIDKKLKNQNLDARIVHIMHDEVIVEAAEGVSQEVADIVKTCMENAFQEIIPKVPFVANPEIRKTWG